MRWVSTIAAEHAHERPGHDFGAAVYGSILVTTLVGAMFEQSAGARSLTLSLLASVLVLWLAHVWSAMIGERVEEGRMFDISHLSPIAAREWPLVEAGLLPGVLLALAWLGLYPRNTGAVLALAVAVLQLVGWGMLAGRRTEPRWGRALAVGLVDGVLGLLIVVAEISVHRI